MQWESMEKLLNSSGIISQDVQFLKKSNKTWRSGKSSQRSSQTGSSSCQCSMTFEWKKNDENCISNAEKVKNYIMRFSEGHWTFLGQKGQWNCTAANMMQRFKETCHLVFQSALSRGILKQKKGKTSIHFNGDSMITELLFQTLTERWRIDVINSVDKRRDEPVLLWTTRF